MHYNELLITSRYVNYNITSPEPFSGYFDLITNVIVPVEIAAVL